LQQTTMGRSTGEHDVNDVIDAIRVGGKDSRDITGHSRILADAISRYARREGGLLNDTIRQQTCERLSTSWPKHLERAILISCIGPVLLGYNSSSSTPGMVREDVSDNDWHALPIHKDENQVRLDVDRAFIYYPLGTLPPASRTLSLMPLHTICTHLPCLHQTNARS